RELSPGCESIPLISAILRQSRPHSLTGPGPRRSLVHARSLVLLQCCSFFNSPRHAFSWPWHATGCCRNTSQKFTPGFARHTSQPSGLESPSVASRCLQISGRLLLLRTAATFVP